MADTPATEVEKTTPVAWKIGDEFAPYHPNASHCHPNYRDGWNHCYQASTALLASKDAEIAALTVRYEAREEEAHQLSEMIIKLRRLIGDHNADCVQQCEARKTAGSTQCPHSAYGRKCPDCPRDGMLDASLAAQAKGGEHV